MELVAYGAQDIFLAERPQITFLNTVWKHNETDDKIVELIKSKDITFIDMLFNFNLDIHYKYILHLIGNDNILNLDFILNNENLDDNKKVCFLCMCHNLGKQFDIIINRVKNISDECINIICVLLNHDNNNDDNIDEKYLYIFEEKCSHNGYLKFIKCLFENDMCKLCNSKLVNFIAERYYNGYFPFEYFNINGCNLLILAISSQEYETNVKQLKDLLLHMYVNYKLTDDDKWYIKEILERYNIKMDSKGNIEIKDHYYYNQNNI